MKFATFVLSLFVLYIQTSSFALDDPEDEFQIDSFDQAEESQVGGLRDGPDDDQVATEFHFVDDLDEDADDPVSFLGRRVKGEKGKDKNQGKCGKGKKKSKCSKGQSCVKQCTSQCVRRRANEDKKCSKTTCKVDGDCCAPKNKCVGYVEEQCLEGKCIELCKTIGEDCTYLGACCRKDANNNAISPYCPSEKEAKEFNVTRTCGACKKRDEVCTSSLECCGESYVGLCKKNETDGLMKCGCMPNAGDPCKGNFQCCKKNGTSQYCDDFGVGATNTCKYCALEDSYCDTDEECCGKNIKCKDNKCTAPSCVKAEGGCNSKESLYCCKKESYCENKTCVACVGAGKDCTKDKDCCADPSTPFCDPTSKKCTCSPAGGDCSESSDGSTNCCSKSPANDTIGKPEREMYCQYECKECVGEGKDCCEKTLPCCTSKAEEKKRVLTCSKASKTCRYVYKADGPCTGPDDCFSNYSGKTECREGSCVACKGEGGSCEDASNCCGEGTKCIDGACRPNKCPPK